MTTSAKDTYIISEYTVTDKETGRPIHKRINLQYNKNPFSGAITGSKLFGSWRNRGFWTEKDYTPEDGLDIVMTVYSPKFMEPNVIKSDEAFAALKNELMNKVKTIIDNTNGAENVKLATYGTDHSHLSGINIPMGGNVPVSNPIDVRKMI